MNDELDRLITELSAEAQGQYEADPVGAVIGYMEDMYRDIDEPVEDNAFVAGYHYGLYHVKEAYISHEQRFTCGCENVAERFVEKGNDGKWSCTTCGQFIVHDPDVYERDVGGDEQ